jgi:hypothetical protein
LAFRDCGQLIAQFTYYVCVEKFVSLKCAKAFPRTGLIALLG